MTNSLLAAVVSGINQPIGYQPPVAPAPPPDPVFCPEPAESDFIKDLPPSEDIEKDMDWAYHNAGDPKPDLRTAPSRSALYMLTYAQKNKTDFIKKYMDMDFKRKARDEANVGNTLDAAKSLAAIDVLIANLPKFAEDTVSADEMTYLLARKV